MKLSTMGRAFNSPLSIEIFSTDVGKCVNWLLILFEQLILNFLRLSPTYPWLCALRLSENDLFIFPKSPWRKLSKYFFRIPCLNPYGFLIFQSMCLTTPSSIYLPWIFDIVLNKSNKINKLLFGICLFVWWA